MCPMAREYTAASVQAGSVVEQGTHCALYRDEGSVYHSLVHLQEQATEKRDKLVYQDLEEAAAADEAHAEAAAAAAGPRLGVRGSRKLSASGRRPSGAAIHTAGLTPGPHKLLEPAEERGSRVGVVSAMGRVEKAAIGDEDELVRCHWCSVVSAMTIMST